MQYCPVPNISQLRHGGHQLSRRFTKQCRSDCQIVHTLDLTHLPDPLQVGDLLSLQAMSTGSAPLPDLSLLYPWLLPLNAAVLVRFVFMITLLSSAKLTFTNLQTETLFYGIQNLSVTELVQVV